MELAVSSRLRAFIPEHRSDIIQLADIGFTIKLVLNVGAYYTCCPFGTKRQIAVTLVLEGIHFAFHDICCFPNAAFEESCVLEHRCTDLTVVETPAEISRLALHHQPFLHCTRQHILRARRFLESFLCHSLSLLKIAKNPSSLFVTNRDEGLS
ncbi:hypothetical protein D3C75_804240 [compost metagenome]